MVVFYKACGEPFFLFAHVEPGSLRLTFLDMHLLPGVVSISSIVCNQDRAELIELTYLIYTVLYIYYMYILFVYLRKSEVGRVGKLVRP